MPPWLHDLIFKAPVHVWKTFERVAIAMFTTRATVPLGIMVVLCWVVHKLTENDLKSVLDEIISSTWLCALGWMLLAISIIVGTVAFRWREKIYQRELERISGVKDQVMNGQLEIKFPRNPAKK